MNEEVKEIFKTNKAYKLDDICKQLDEKDKEKIEKILNELEISGYLIKEEDKYKLFPEDFRLVTIKIYKDGNGYCYIDDDLYIIDSNNLNGALDGDLCAVNYYTGVIDKIVKRSANLIICELKDDAFTIQNSYSKCKVDVEGANVRKLVNGNVILAKIKNYDKDTLKCDLVEILGHIDDPDIELKKIAIKNNFKVNFSKDAIKQADSIKETVQEDELEGRLDLRDKLIYTIDDDHTKDMDDAISIEINDKGNYVIGVHIADVSHYIRPNTPLFNEAMQRGNSLYMLNTVIPMLMHKLSNGICSLNPNVDRLTISCIAEVDKNGNIVDYDIKKSIINSKKKMSYSNVNKILMDKEITPGYEEFVDNLKLANEASFALNKNYKEHGYIQFGNNEIKYTGEEDSEFKRIVPRAAEKIIEDFMLLANKIVASNFEYVPFPFRVHDIPDTKKLKKTFDYLRLLGYKIPNVKNLDNPKTLQGILKDLYDKGDYSITSPFILKAMKKASYSTENIGHFGLGFDAYTHFTSPIRRFKDLLVHTIVSEYINPDFNEEELDYINENLYKMCEHISETEVNADKAEDEALRYKMADFMKDKINEYFNGKIIVLRPRYAIVKLENNIIGVANIEDMKDICYFDNNDYCIKQRFGNDTYKVGDYVRIRTLYIDKNWKIGLRITENLNRLKNGGNDNSSIEDNNLVGTIIDIQPSRMTVKLDNDEFLVIFFDDFKDGTYYFDEYDYVVKSERNNEVYKLGSKIEFKLSEVNSNIKRLNGKVKKLTRD